MGAIFSYVMSWIAPGPTYDETPDPVTGLSEKDCHAIMDTWALVSDRKSIKQNGVEFFIVLFTAHPYLLSFFPAFKDLSDDEMRKSPGLRAHATSVMYALKSFVGTIDDGETLTGLLTKMATSHVPRGIKSQDIENLGGVFLDFMRDALGTQWTPEAAKAWKQLFTVHCTLYKRNEAMGNLYSYIMSWLSPGPTYDLTPDPVTGLNEKDCQAIMSTWGQLTAERKSIKKHGAEFFIRLFKVHPQMQEFFSAFKGRPVEDLRECPQMAAHATTVMYAFKSYVGSVDDAETLSGLVTKIASSHVPRDITTDDFDKVAVVLIDFLKGSLGANFTPEAETAWKQLLKVHNIIYRGVEVEMKATK